MRNKTSRNETSFKLVLYLFCEGKTEREYISDIVRALNLSNDIYVRPIALCSPPASLLTKALKWRQDNKTLFNSAIQVRSEIWLIFDADNNPNEMKRFQELFIQKRKRIETTGFRFAWMAPCFETWPLLHFIPPNKISQEHREVQRTLHQLMQSYDHDKNPYVDCQGVLSEIPKIKNAIKAAKNWEHTYDLFPDCVLSAPHYAGIYALLEELLAFQDDKANRAE